MKAIETKYAGCRFRSRLEARWAVVFDHLRINWQYEAEGFEFDDGTHYLPDFWFPELSTYVEIKPELRWRDTKWATLHAEVNVADWFVPHDGTDPGTGHLIRDSYAAPGAKRTFMFGPIPRPNHGAHVYEYGCALGPGSPHNGWAFARCGRCNRYDIAHVGIASIMSCGHAIDPHDDSVEFSWFPHDAYIAGTTARFDHGQTPDRPTGRGRGVGLS